MKSKDRKMAIRNEALNCCSVQLCSALSLWHIQKRETEKARKRDQKLERKEVSSSFRSFNDFFI